MAEAPPPDADAGPDLESLLLRAGFNFHVFLAAALGLLPEAGVEPQRLIERVAERLAPTWAGLHGHGADAVLHLVLENLASTGYAVREVQPGADEATATLGLVPLGLSDADWASVLAPFGATPAAMRALFDVFAPLAAAAGAQIALHVEADALRIVVRRQGAAPRPADLA
ncbi:MAG TPA: hypothetical protein VKV26_10210 [Dehalococcoidia bacterium]|nr:hypothetical protein [Dehalococcoidia bacterium]